MRTLLLSVAVSAALCACGGNADTHSAPRSGTPADAPTSADPATNASGAATPADGTFQIPSGRDGVRPISIEVVAKGDGMLAQSGDKVVLHYTGTFADGKQFDSSRGSDSDGPFAFRLGRGRVIDGWDMVVARMHVGDRWIATIPYQLAYGADGRPPVIPPRADLTFDMELLGVR